MRGALLRLISGLLVNWFSEWDGLMTWCSPGGAGWRPDTCPTESLVLVYGEAQAAVIWQRSMHTLHQRLQEAWK